MRSRRRRFRLDRRRLPPLPQPPRAGRDRSSRVRPTAARLVSPAGRHAVRLRFEDIEIVDYAAPGIKAPVAVDYQRSMTAGAPYSELGCGHPGGIDHLESRRCRRRRLRPRRRPREPIALPDESVSQFLISHVIEHIRDSLGLMQDLWRLAAPGAIAVIRVPHGGSDDAWEDPTHLRAYFPGSFGYFSQPFYSNADYGYRADWNPDKLTLLVHRSLCAASHAAADHQQVAGRTERREGDDLRDARGEADARGAARAADAGENRSACRRLNAARPNNQKKARREEDSGQGGPFSGSGRREADLGRGANRRRSI